jgi:hypothetical protein
MTKVFIRNNSLVMRSGVDHPGELSSHRIARQHLFACSMMRTKVSPHLSAPAKGKSFRNSSQLSIPASLPPTEVGSLAARTAMHHKNAYYQPSHLPDPAPGAGLRSVCPLRSSGKLIGLIVSRRLRRKPLAHDCLSIYHTPICITILFTASKTATSPPIISP